jgi:hypothetical protein
VAFSRRFVTQRARPTDVSHSPDASGLAFCGEHSAARHERGLAQRVPLRPSSRAHADDQRARGRAWAQERLPVEIRRQFLDALYGGQPFRQVLRDLGLTSNRGWGLTKTYQDWSVALETALTATRRDDIKHGTTAAYVRGCVCSECREHQRRRMAKNRK